MRKALHVPGAILLILALVLVGCGTSAPASSSQPKPSSGSAPEIEKVTLRLTHDQKADSQYGQIGKKFAEIVAKESGGAITVKTFEAGELYSGPNEMAKAVQQGTVDLAIVSAPAMGNIIPEWEIVKVPGLLTSPVAPYSRARADTFVKHEKGGRKIVQMAEAKDIKTLIVYNKEDVQLWAAKPAQRLADVKGWRIRTSESRAYKETIEALAGQWVPLAAPEVVTSFQQKMLEATTSGPEYWLNARWHEITPYAIGNLFLSPATIGFWMNLGSWKKLSPQAQKLIAEKGVTQTEEYINKTLLPLNDKELWNKVLATGVKVIEWPSEDIEAYTERTQKYWEGYRSAYGELLNVAIEINKTVKK